MVVTVDIPDISKPETWGQTVAAQEWWPYPLKKACEDQWSTTIVMVDGTSVCFEHISDASENGEWIQLEGAGFYEYALDDRLRPFVIPKCHRGIWINVRNIIAAWEHDS